MKTYKDNNISSLSSFIEKKSHVKYLSRTQNYFERVIEFGLLQFGSKPHNNFSIGMSNEIIKTVQKQ